MPKYKIAFDLEKLLSKLAISAYIESIGFTAFEICLTTLESLTSEQIRVLESRLPFTEITLVKEG